jgi:gliding motility-associated-like protein
MTGRILSNTNRLLFCLLILLSFSSAAFSFQTKVSGVSKNLYGRVTGKGADFVIVNNPAEFSQFKANDTVLVIQMKGAQAKIIEDFTYGNLQAIVGAPGKYEFMTILSVDPGLKMIVFRNNIINSYDVTGDVQIIKVPSYNSILVDAELTCAPWDSLKHTGGVLSMIVGKTIKLNANIDVTGKGFRGGDTVSGAGLCVRSDVNRFNKYSFPRDSTNSGFKGESPASSGWVDFSTQYPIFPNYSKGKGANLSGGGGGNGNFSGGGGGANYGAGGKGGRESNSCSPPEDGGLGGKQIIFTALDGGIFPGSGGGSSTYKAGSASFPGGNGGGIIIIICDSIIGNGKIIKADGAGALNAGAANTGAGGGGGGGSIALYLGGLSNSNLTLSANGGKGGDNTPQFFGEGGGGGGGLILINNIAIPGNVTRTVSGGPVGLKSGGTSTGTSGAAGTSSTNFVAALNGFLFNSIRSSVTGDQTDSVCSNMTPPKITGTRPVGGSGKYTYLWEKSYDGSIWTSFANPDSTNFTPLSPEVNPIWYRRTITDFNNPSLVDISKPVKIIVQQFIKNNIVGYPDTICYNQDPPLIHQLLPDVSDGNNKSYFFNWQDSTASGSWGSTIATTKDYDPPAGLTRTTWYRRTVVSGRCIDSAARAKMTVLPDISGNNILSSNQEICYGMLFDNLSATVAPGLSGGDNSYRFRWESSKNTTTWVTATGVSNGSGYNPDELSSSFPGIEYYRRTVYSGIHDVCVSISPSVLLKDFPVLGNNTISASQTIGHDSVPATLNGSIPVYGSLSYLYLWQFRTRNLPWASAAGLNNAVDYSPAPLTDTTWYRRVVNSSACSDTSNIIVINVHKTIINNTISFASGAVEDTICNGAIPSILKGIIPSGGSDIPADYAFKWYFSSDNVNWTQVSPGATTQDYQPGALSAGSIWFRRYVSSPVISPTSISKSNSIKITVLPLITNKDIFADQMVCKGNPLQPLISVIGGPAGGDGVYRYTWRQDSAGTGWKNIPGYTMTSSSSYSRSSIKDPFRYKRYIYSGIHNVCSDSSNYLNVGIHSLPTAVITSVSDTTVCSGSPVPVKMHFTGASKWRLIYEENGVQSTIGKIQSADTALLINRTPSGTMSTYTFKIDSLKDANTCIALPATLTGSRKIEVYRVPKAEAGIPVDSVCGPGYQLAAIPSFGTGTWTWSKITASSVPAEPVFVPGTSAPKAKVTVDLTTSELKPRYRFFWKESNWNCPDRDSVTITFHKQTDPLAPIPPKILFTFSKKDTLKTVSPVVGRGYWTVKASGDTLSNNGIVSGLVLGDNLFEWKIVNGLCSSATDFNIKVYDVKIPQGFSPNGDNINDEFKIEGLDPGYNDITFRIRNSAGAEVFNTDNNGWSDFTGNDNNNKPLPEGTYYYLLTISPKDNAAAVRSWSGFIILKRY